MIQYVLTFHKKYFLKLFKITLVLSLIYYYYD